MNNISRVLLHFPGKHQKTRSLISKMVFKRAPRALSVIAIFLTVMVPARCGVGITPLQFFLGTGENLDKVIPIEFKPDDGEKLRERFQRKYGFRGERLIASFGGKASALEENHFNDANDDELFEEDQKNLQFNSFKLM